ncbi:hypothetical protein [Actinomadura kijaniata]|uniref:hypothetical protein n=1 Tax=Actinomadura kijaniata TaxID=46161 RepID=UPI0008329C7A|nr:hypothetical protein [Actinomadura kijaniata]
MVRKIFALVALVALVAAGCGGHDRSAVTSGAHGSSPATTSAATTSASPAACPSEQNKKFAKTRFAADAGLAFGAFHRWIWKPYQAGTFQSGAEGRTAAMVKAAAAGAFALNRLNAARKLVDDDPTLCKALKQPLDALWNSVNGLTEKLRSGNLNPAEIGTVGGAIDAFRDRSKQAGTEIKDREPPSLGN